MKENFFKNHADTIAIIGVNLAIFTILVGLFIMNVSSISASNARMDMMQNLIHQETKDFHGRLCAIEERNKK